MDDDNQYPVCPDCGQRHPPSISDEDAAKLADQIIEVLRPIQNPIDAVNVLMTVLVDITQMAASPIKLRILQLLGQAMGITVDLQTEPQFAALKPGSVILPGNGSVN